MNDLMKITSLGEIFKPYGIYPQDRFHEKTAVRVFQNTHPFHHYAKEAEHFIQTQPVNSDRIGADMPYWGKKYFSKEKGTRYFIISQDSNSLDAGSIVFYAQLMNNEISPDEINTYINKHCLTKFRSWGEARKFLLLELELDMDYVYLTDAKKVYPIGKKEQNLKADQNQRQKWLSFEEETSRKLVFEEIELCSPDVIIAMGTNALDLLNPNLPTQSVILEENKLIQKIARTIKCENGKILNELIYSPLPSGANRKYFNQESKIKVKEAIYKYLA
ncbi:uracil-DNA glycosylase family protein [Neobacillus drentensis]|uniref:uracil-DNA glycosylase family protein n=1 Tax=Neobacillus drentensis TaxID=220684 RepID=UPI002FFEB323